MPVQAYRVYLLQGPSKGVHSTYANILKIRNRKVRKNVGIG
jgi:hypothetical protein